MPKINEVKVLSEVLSQVGELARCVKGKLEVAARHSDDQVVREFAESALANLQANLTEANEGKKRAKATKKTKPKRTLRRPSKTFENANALDEIIQAARQSRSRQDDKPQQSGTK